MAGKALEYLISQPWAVRADLLEVGLSIVLRETAPSPDLVKAKSGRAMDGTATVEIRDGVAVIPINGPIFRYADWFVEMCGGTTVDTLAKDFRAALDNSAVRSILLLVDSPGGEANGIAEMAAMIRERNGSTKPVVAYVGFDCCSAAYWLASATDEIVVAPTAWLGSIGTVMGWPKKRDDPKSIEFVSAQSPNKRPDPQSESGRAVVQAMVDDMTTVFISAVASYRGVTPETVASDFGQGGILIGQKAVDAGLADRLGSFEGVLAELSRGHAPKPKSPQPPPKSSPASKGGASASTSPSASKGKPMAANWFTKMFKQAVAEQPDDQPIDLSAITGLAPAATLKTVGFSEPKEGVISFENSPEFKTMKARLDAAEKSVIASTEASAKTFVLDLVKGSQLLPASSDAATKLLVQLAGDDRANPLAEGSRMGSLQTLLTGLHKHGLTTESATADKDGNPKLPPGSTVIPSTTEGKDPKAPMTQAELEKMLALTDEGKAALAKLKANK